MCKKLIYLVSFVLVLTFAGNALAQLPAGWSEEWIGDETPPGSADYDAATETWTLIGHGHDIWDNADDFHYVYKRLSGDGQITARVVTLAGDSSHGWSKAGVMIRETLDDTSTHAMECVTGGEGAGIAFQWRPSTGGGSVWSDSTQPVVSPPYWVRMVRTGDLLEGFHSPDGDTWEKEGEITIGMARDVYIGISLTSHESGVTRTATFDNVYIGLTKVATGPTPADGAIYADTWANLSWNPGAYAVSHDVYFGENFDDVNDGAEGVFQGNQAVTNLIVGFPGFPYPEGLVPGTTYYWRINEVNDTEPNSPWKGNVWSFMVPPRTAYNPNPADGAKFVDTDVELSWDIGFNAKLHYVHFGDNFDDVNSATVGIPSALNTYTPGTLELEKTYYWRIDEFDGAATYKGDVWSFRTLPIIAITDPSLVGWWKLDEDMGTTAVDWSGHGNHGTFEGDPQWVPGYDGAALEFDGIDDYVNFPYVTDPTVYTICAWVRPADTSPANIIVRTSPSGPTVHWSHQLRINSSGTFEHYVWDGTECTVMGTTTVRADTWYHVVGIATNNGQVWLYVNGWAEGASASVGTMWADGDRFVVGSNSGGGMGQFDGLIDDVRVYNKTLTLEEIQQTMRGDPLLAGVPNPTNGSTPYIREATPLSWSPGENASQHDVYFGIDRDAVADANASDTTGIYRGRQGVTIYTPPEVEWGGGPYYWRVDEYNTDATISKGNIWSFTVADFILVDDFEDYNDYEPDRIFDTWVDGWEVPTNGSMAGHADRPFAETDNVHGGRQSMPVYYENNFKYSEVTMTLVSVRDWTKEGVGVLSLWFSGAAANAAERMYVNLNGIATVYHDNPDAALIDTWTEWTIDLQEFAAQGVNLANVTTISIGFGDKNNLQAGGSGMVFFDDIRLYRPAPPEPEPAP